MASLFVPLTVSLEGHILILVKFSCQFSSVMHHDLGVTLINLCLIHEYKDFHVFLLEVLQLWVLDLGLWSILINFCIWWEIRIEVHFFPYDYLIAPGPFTEKIIFPSLNCPYQLTIYRFISRLFSVPSILTSTILYLDYYPTLFFSKLFVFSQSLAFPYEL